MPGSETLPLRLQPLLSPQRPKFPLSEDGLGLVMDSLRCLCTENPGDWKGWLRPWPQAEKGHLQE